MNEKGTTQLNAFDKLIRQINDTANDVQRERGTLFERLVVAYLKNEPTYRNLYTDVWMLGDIPVEYHIPKKDTGVDIVARQKNGDLVAVQAKFYTSKVGKDQINSYIAELGKSYYQSGLIVSTTDQWNSNALETIEENDKGIEVIGLSDLRNSQIEWSQFSFERPDKVETRTKKHLRSYQRLALEDALKYYGDHDRGQLIMAPGTGKTFTSLKIAEALAEKKNGQFRVLYLVPSIQLLTQTLRGWNNDADLTMTSMAVTSDRDASRDSDGTEDLKATDIGYPATTSTSKLIDNWTDVERQVVEDDMLVVFSTYQSIDVIGQAQNQGFPEFDLIIADEAHRTTGAHEANKEDSPFTKVHSNENIKGIKRIYQTATPKIYGESAKKNAKDKSILLSSMDDVDKFGEVFYRMGFGQAVSHGILTDYKVMVLAVDEAAIQKDMQKTLSDPENGLDIDDVGRIVGIWNGMMRRNGYKNPIKNSAFDGAPLERAIAFTRTIADSKKVSEQFEEVVNDYLGGEDDDAVTLKMRHADGSMKALQKGEVLDWLADSNKPENEARIVSNVRFLTEGIDVPTLDAVIFLAPKKSQVDIVQAVGRIMRKAENKEYGYIILPIVIPTNETPETILDNNKNYQTVWQVINALRSVDERFEAMIDKINIAKPKNLKVIGVGSAPDETNTHDRVSEDDESNYKQTKLDIEWDKFETAIYGKIVEKVGDRKYLENWSKDVAKIAQRQIDWIENKLKAKKDPITIEFKKFVKSLQHNINMSIDEKQAAEMLSQHLITKPIFEALFDQYSFVNNNPVSSAMEKIVVELENAGFTKEQELLEPLYESVRMRAEGVKKASDKQKIIITLYEQFFSTAFKSTTERLGIVFTPIEVVDFIVHSVDDALQKYFNKSIASKGVHILDPFTGTGTFIVRTLTYLKQKMDVGEITLADITTKYTQELHANEIVLLSYYIAAINIEATFDDINGEDRGYEPFDGIVLTDTFESTEQEDTIDDKFFGINDERLKKQQEIPITVVIGNPPYSAKQTSVNDNNANMKYPKLDKRLVNTYVSNSTAVNKNNLYDPYIKALRWSSDRIGNKGVIGFVTGAGFIDGLSTDGLRKSIYKEFNYLYIFNLRGNANTKGEQRKKESGNIFGMGSKTPIAISILVKDQSNNHELYYHDIGDYLSGSAKLSKILKLKSILQINWIEIEPDKNNDWINQRDENYFKYSSIADDSDSIFLTRTTGYATSRDPWVISFSKFKALKNSKKLVDEFNRQVQLIHAESKLERDLTKINWSDDLLKRWSKHQEIEFASNLRLIQYRPFTKKWVNNLSPIIGRPRIWDSLFGQSNNEQNFFLNFGSGNNFDTLISDQISDYQLLFNNKVMPLFTYEENSFLNNKLVNISTKWKSYLGNEENVFSYIYAVTHSPYYCKKYSNDLKKTLPRIPFLKNKEQYVDIGWKLANLHLRYEDQPSWNGVQIEMNENPSYRVEKMKHPKKGILDTIIYNNDIKITNIPERAYKYIVNGKPAIEWIIDQYRIKTDSKSGIIDDPNDFSDDPKYILNLLLSVITVSMKTLELVDQLPKFEVINNEKK